MQYSLVAQAIARAAAAAAAPTMKVVCVGVAHVAAYSVRSTEEVCLCTPQFESEAATWLTATHTNFMVHAAAAAAARTSATAIKKYCQRRMVDDYIVRAVDNAPPLVPRPGDV